MLVVAALGCGLLSCGATSSGGSTERASSGAGGSAGLPNLRTGRPSFSRDGDAIRVAVTVRNRGHGRAAKNKLAVYLSADRRRGGGDSWLGRIAVPALAAGKHATVRRALPLSRARGSGLRWLIGCADGRHRVREASETDNCRASRRRLRVGSGTSDSLPPSFGGLVSATTCSPGPGGPGFSSPFKLRWEAATDTETPAEALVYDVYRASEPGGETLDSPAYTTSPGATTFTTPPLSTERAWYFIVRARDAAGNRDGNRVERAGENVCD
jgi:CARDB protein